MGVEVTNVTPYPRASVNHQENAEAIFDEELRKGGRKIQPPLEFLYYE